MTSTGVDPLESISNLDLFICYLELADDLGEIRFNTAPPSTNIFVTLRLWIIGETNNGKHPTVVVRSG